MRKNAFAVVAEQPKPEPEPTGAEPTPTSYPKHRQGKKAVISYHSPALSKALRQIALNNDTTLQAITEEAYALVLQRYGVKVSEQDL